MSCVDQPMDRRLKAQRSHIRYKKTSQLSVIFHVLAPFLGLTSLCGYVSNYQHGGGLQRKANKEQTWSFYFGIPSTQLPKTDTRKQHTHTSSAKQLSGSNTQPHEQRQQPCWKFNVGVSIWLWVKTNGTILGYVHHPF